MFFSSPGCFSRGILKVSLNLSVKILTCLIAFLFQVFAGVSSGAPSSSSSTIEMVDPALR